MRSSPSRDVDRQRLTRLSRGEDNGRPGEPQPRYFHPHGYVIQRETRDWALGSITRGAAHQYAPLHWWEIHPHVGSAADIPSRRRLGAAYDRLAVLDGFPTLREARRWCDEHPREGWES